MPIPQETMLKTLKLSAHTLETLDLIEKILTKMRYQTAEINLSLERISDPIAEKILRELWDQILMLNEVLTDNMPEISDRLMIVERLAYYKINFRKNELARKYQQRKREKISAERSSRGGAEAELRLESEREQEREQEQEQALTGSASGANAGTGGSPLRRILSGGATDYRLPKPGGGKVI